MKIKAISFSLSPRLPSKTEWFAQVHRDIELSLKEGCEIIVFPELFLLGLSEYYEGDFPQQLKGLAQDLENVFLPELTQKLKNQDILLVLGSGPRIAGGALRNSSPIFLGGQWHHQDKIHLTPWETDFTPGSEVNIFTFRKLRIAVLICYDVEQPSLASALKAQGIDVLLVPSATADRNGNQRVIRCSSARSIELGAAVLSVPLIGKSSCDLVDISEGRQAYFLPAQAAVKVPQEQDSSYETEKAVHKIYELDPELLSKLKQPDAETKPYFKSEAAVRLRIHS